MSAFRTTLGWTTMATATPVLAVAAMAAGRIDPIGRSSHRVAHVWARLLLAAAGVRTTCAGAEPPAPIGPRVLMSNHLSSLDIPVLLACLDPALRPGFLAKDSLFRVPLLGGAMRTLGCVPVAREDSMTAPTMLAAALRILRSGRSLVAFPEGTWGPGDEMLPFHRGPFLLALRAQAPIVPIALGGSERVLPASARAVRPGCVTVRFGDAVATAGMGVSALGDLVVRVRVAIEALQCEP